MYRDRALHDLLSRRRLGRIDAYDEAVRYVAPEVFRARLVSEPKPTYKAQLNVSYEWLKTHWYGGLEFRTEPATGAEIQRVTLPCGRGQC